MDNEVVGIVGIDTPIIAGLEPDQTRNVLQEYLFQSIDRGVQLFSEHFPEGDWGDQMLLARHEALDEGCKILIVHNVPFEVWEGWKETIRRHYNREIQPKLELRNGSLYVSGVHTFLYKQIQEEITSQLIVQYLNGNLHMPMRDHIIERRNDDNGLVDRIVPDIVIKDTSTNNILGAIEIETRYRPPSASRRRLFDFLRMTGPEIEFVASVRIRKTGDNSTFVATMILWIRANGGELACAAHDFGTAPMEHEEMTLWRNEDPMTNANFFPPPGDDYRLDNIRPPIQIPFRLIDNAGQYQINLQNIALRVLRAMHG